MLMMVLSAIGLWRGAGLIERLGEATPGQALIEAGAGEALLRDGRLDLSGMRAERGPEALRNGFSMGGGQRPAPADSATPAPGGVGAIGNLMGLIGGGAGDEDVEEDAPPPPPKPTSIVRVHEKGTR